MTPEILKDLEGITGHIFDFEYQDMIECLSSEPLFLEEGIITEEEIEELDTLDGGHREQNDRMLAIVEKACENPNNRHIYALAYRIWKEFLVKKSD